MLALPSAVAVKKRLNLKFNQKQGQLDQVSSLLKLEVKPERQVDLMK
jgi:hypothetical protein